MRRVVRDRAGEDVPLLDRRSTRQAMNVLSGVDAGPVEDGQRVVVDDATKRPPYIDEHQVQSQCLLLGDSSLRQHLVCAVEDDVGEVRVGLP